MPLHLLTYRLLIIILSPIIFVHVFWLAIKNRQKRYFWQRLGFSYTGLAENCIWFHCASVGEFITLLPLLKNLHKHNAELKIIITTNTITGSNVVSQQHLNYLYHAYLPIDCPFAVKRFISKINPTTLFVMETEIWPNLFSRCQQNKIPVYIINARLSKKTTSANQWIKSLLGYSLSKVTKIYSRSEDNSLAYQDLGAANKQVITVGNLKFTTAIQCEQDAEKTPIITNRAYVLAASTHNDEELQIYTHWKKLKRDELLVIAPRHPERSAAIYRQLSNVNIAVRSKNQQITEHTEVYLLDTIGELKQLYPKARLVIMGGSFIPLGGHNILEPAASNRAIITGPYMANFTEELELLLEKQAIVQVNSYQDMAHEISKLLSDKDYRSSLENNTKKLTDNVEKILSDYTELIVSAYKV